MNRRKILHKITAGTVLTAMSMSLLVLPVQAQAASWVQSGNDWWYRHEDGGYTTSGWEKINGSWYYFDSKGWMQTGWLELDGTWYYLKPDGAMVSGWNCIDGREYYFTENGAMLSNQWIQEWYVDSSGAWDRNAQKAQWILSGDRWWYRHTNGGFTRDGWEKINGNWYHFDKEGWMQTGWLELDGTWYYLQSDGVMKTDWLFRDNSWYYLKPDGAMETKWGSIKGELYYFDEKGHMQTGWQMADDIWYYFEDSGRMSDSAAASERRPEGQEKIVEEAFQRVHEDIAFIQERMEKYRIDQMSRKTYPYPEKEKLYDTMTDQEKAVYDEVLEHIMEYEPLEYTAAEDGYEKMDKAMLAMITIHQDYTFTKNHVVIQDVLDGNRTTAVQLKYFMPGDPKMKPVEDINSLKYEMAVFDEECNQIVAGMPEGLSAYDQYMYLAGVICLRTDYDYDFVGGWQVGSSYGAIQGGKSICAGYSEGYDYLCRKAGLYCKVVSGTAGNDEGHAWNLVRLADGTYHVDVTWCDEQGSPFTGNWRYYFMCTQQQISRDHNITDGTVATGKNGLYKE